MVSPASHAFAAFAMPAVEPVGIEAEPSRAATASACPLHRTTILCSNCCRPVARVQATSVSDARGVARRYCTRATRARSRAALVLALSTNVTGNPAGVAGAGARGGACSSTTCTFVPPRPNALTPARRGPSIGQPVRPVLT